MLTKKPLSDFLITRIAMIVTLLQLGITLAKVPMIGPAGAVSRAVTKESIEINV